MGSPTPPAPCTPPIPTNPGTSQPQPQSRRPQRTRRPNPKYNKAEWSLDTFLGPLVEDSPTLSSKQVVNMLHFVANKMGYVTDSQP